MIDRIKHALLFALYQTTIALGILLMPVALVLGQVGITLPMHRVVERLDAAYERATASNAA